MPVILTSECDVTLFVSTLQVRLQTSFVNQRSHCLSRYFDSQGERPGLHCLGLMAPGFDTH